ncbi:MAG: hypothetical protein DWQ47_01785 [Acidobacteria bacterium]|nr:MAG: hypothetical protein DWQ32_05335 [Acidobacteriota bacterium]REK01155.1 MAG: hypothetical protein DWQ38_01770 [Acidobacteriota bacterium]REK14111.1 MAG: hypothetical protein DWQ43_11025 [Acidobacteriota bacterium]REK44826.1 MAG: hypothetical protein DWQ47_01785 [Acidobacteriota bacterium]
MRKIISAALAVLFLVSPSFSVSWGSGPERFEPSTKSWKEARKLLSKMTVDEKLGQLVHIGLNARFMNRESNEFLRLKREIEELKVGGVVVFAGPVYETVHLINRLQELAPYPLLISADFETGVGMRLTDTVNLPWNMAFAAAGDPELARKAGEITGREALAVGVRQVFAPVIDINDNPYNPVINVRSYGQDPGLVLALGKAFADGVQSRRVIATAKHFPGHGNTTVDSHRGLPEIDRPIEKLEKNELVPFKGLIEGGVASVMVSHISMPALDPQAIEPIRTREKGAYGDSEIVTGAGTVPATLSRPIVTELLKGEMKFEGLVVTDAMDMAGLTIYFEQKEAAVRALLAGNDILLKPEDAATAIQGLRDALETGRIPIRAIDEAVLKQLAWKFELGLFKHRQTSLDTIDGIVSSAETADLAARVADGAITLVENRNDSVPLRKKGTVFVLCVTNGFDHVSAGRSFVSELAAERFEVQRMAIDERSGPEAAAASLKLASDADHVIIAMFGRVRSGAPNSIGLPETGVSAIKQILSARSDTISVSFGNPYLINDFSDMGAYVVAYGEMQSLQKAAAEKIIGSSEFKGRLPVDISSKHKRGTGLRTK